MNARVVNQGGLVQANSIREHNGVIELVASDSLSLGSSSSLSAQGDSQGGSPGGQILVKSEKQFTDASGSAISVAGGSAGGQGGKVEISAPEMDSIHSRIDGSAVSGWRHGEFLIDPYNITLSSSGGSAGSGTIGLNDPPTALNSTLTLDVNSFANFPGMDIILQAAHDIVLNTRWSLDDATDRRMLTLQAGNNITFNNGAGITAGVNWGVTMTSGADFVGPSSVVSGIGSIRLNGNSFLETLDGSISISAGKEVLVGTGAIRTLAGGSINVSALSGDVNSGLNPNGYEFNNDGYEVILGGLGGISTLAGGDVTISAGRNVTSFLPSGKQISDAGSGAFGPEPGVVTITAGGNVTGHFVAADSERNGQIVPSVITALTGDAGTSANALALSLVRGGWQVNAPNGNIFLQEVRNPNGVFNGLAAGQNPFRHRFDYDLLSFVDLSAPLGGVTLSGKGLPRISTSPVDNVFPLYPGTLNITSGNGGVTLGNNLILFPSPNGELNINTSGSMQTDQSGVVYSLTMSDSGQSAWTSKQSFTDHATTPVQLNNPDPVTMTWVAICSTCRFSHPKKPISRSVVKWIMWVFPDRTCTRVTIPSSMSPAAYGIGMPLPLPRLT